MRLRFPAASRASRTCAAMMRVAVRRLLTEPKHDEVPETRGRAQAGFAGASEGSDEAGHRGAPVPRPIVRHRDPARTEPRTRQAVELFGAEAAGDLVLGVEGVQEEEIQALLGLLRKPLPSVTRNEPERRTFLKSEAAGCLHD